MYSKQLCHWRHRRPSCCQDLDLRCCPVVDTPPSMSSCHRGCPYSTLRVGISLCKDLSNNNVSQIVQADLTSAWSIYQMQCYTLSQILSVEWCPIVQVLAIHVLPSLYI